MCDPSVAERITGYVVGGISPFGQKRPCPTFVDEWATALEVVHCSGGRRGLEARIGQCGARAPSFGDRRAAGRSRLLRRAALMHWQYVVPGYLVVFGGLALYYQGIAVDNVNALGLTGSYAARAVIYYSALPILTGLPATTVPLGLSQDGLPIGIQAIGLQVPVMTNE